MSNNNMSESTGDGHVRRKPSYSEVLKSPPTRPAPINTEIARSNNTGAKMTASTISTGFSTAGNTSVGSSLTAATSLFTPSIWSPIPDGTQSATIPGKDSWDRAMQKTYAQAANSPPQQSKKLEMLSSTTPKTPSFPVGVGLNVGNKTTNKQYEKNNNTASPINATPYQYQQSTLTDAQTSPFLQDGGVPISNTYPLMQQQFSASRDTSYQHRIFPQRATGTAFAYKLGPKPASPNVTIPSQVTADVCDESGTGEAESPGSDMFSPPDTPSIMITQPSDPSKGHDNGVDIPEDPNMLSVAFATSTAASDLSDRSDISEHCEAEQRDSDEKAPPVSQEPHPRSFGRIVLANDAGLAEAFPGAFETCKALNPGVFQMPYGSRAICIKTDFVENVQWSIQKGLWTTMNKVGERMNQLWDARETKNVKVFLLFSVNGQKSYCGLAEMTGHWISGEENIGGFVTGGEEAGSRHWGTLPVTWLYCKNISYNWFGGIRHSHNDAPIVNMWNGMHYPSAVGRQVIELYVKRTHFTNIICWVEGGNYDPFKPVLKASQIDPLADEAVPAKTQGPNNGPPQPRLIENVPPPADRTKNHAMQSNNWRQPQKQYVGKTSGAHTNAGQTPVAPNRQGVMHSGATATPPSNIDGHFSPTRRTTKVIQCIVDGNGNYVPIDSSGHTSIQASTQARRANTAVPPSGGVAVAYGQQLDASRANTMHGGGPGVGAHGGSYGPGPDVHSSRGGYISSNIANLGGHSPGYGRGHGSYRQPVSPAINRVLSEVGLEDPFGTPRTLHGAKSAESLVSPKSSMGLTPGNKAALHRAVSTANFLPQASTPTGGPAPEIDDLMAGASTYRTASHLSRKVTPTPHAFGNSGGVALHPYGSVPPVESTPSHFPANRHSLPPPSGIPSLTPGGLPTYPTSSDQGGIADADVDANAQKLQLEYLEALQRQSEVETTLARMKLEEYNKRGIDTTGSPSMKAGRNPGGKD